VFSDNMELYLQQRPDCLTNRTGSLLALLLC